MTKIYSWAVASLVVFEKGNQSLFVNVTNAFSKYEAQAFVTEAIENSSGMAVRTATHVSFKIKTSRLFEYKNIYQSTLEKITNMCEEGKISKNAAAELAIHIGAIAAVLQTEEEEND